MTFVQKAVVTYYRVKYALLAKLAPDIAAKSIYYRFISPFGRSRKSILLGLYQTAERISRQSKGIQINGFRWVGSSTKKALLIHGFEGDAGSLSDYVQPFLDRGYGVLAFDGPAHGFSEGKQLDLYDYAQLITEILNDNPEIEAFVAHSFGCPSLMLALEQKQTIPHPYKLVLIAPAAEVGSAMARFASYFGIEKFMQTRVYDYVFERTGHPPSWFSLKRVFIEIKLPLSVFVAHDKDDEVTPIADTYKFLEDKHPFIDFFTTSGLGHNQIYKDAEVQKRVFEFMDK
jgi:pimeloyl-ACP methyl ester carboxylesterase